MSLFYISNLGGRAYPVRHYPIAIRLRDREGRAVLCVALIPQSGDSSGATLGVRSVALLHALWGNADGFLDLPRQLSLTKMGGDEGVCTLGRNEFFHSKKLVKS